MGRIGWSRVVSLTLVKQGRSPNVRGGTDKGGKSENKILFLLYIAK